MEEIDKSLHTELGHSTPGMTTVRGRDLPSEILGRFNLGDMVFLELTGRTPTPQQLVTFNPILVTLVEHGRVVRTRQRLRGQHRRRGAHAVPSHCRRQHTDTSTRGHA